jgi:hypothetical protein
MQGFWGGKETGKKYIGRGCKTEDCFSFLVSGFLSSAPPVHSAWNNWKKAASDAGGTNQLDLQLSTGKSACCPDGVRIAAAPGRSPGPDLFRAWPYVFGCMAVSMLIG